MDEAVVLQRDGEPVGGRPRQPGGLDELRQRGGTRLQGVQHQNRFVKYADSARVVHDLILPSRYVRCKSDGEPGATRAPGANGIFR
ncbi:hypothetical protein GCM10022416_20810 [Actinomadura keratinilytica]|uniref:Uncharacterized protein n=1 Tax=Actinomadura keratinilytica TaxID=547461 RepID=A0ABP7YIS6_9ACTN